MRKSDVKIGREYLALLVISYRNTRVRVRVLEAAAVERRNGPSRPGWRVELVDELTVPRWRQEPMVFAPGHEFRIEPRQLQREWTEEDTRRVRAAAEERELGELAARYLRELGVPEREDGNFNGEGAADGFRVLSRCVEIDLEPALALLERALAVSA